MMATSPKSFVWYELMTSDMAGADAFYRGVIGWGSRDWDEPGMQYKIMTMGERPVGGVMPMPEDYIKAGGRPCWVGYIAVDDVDAATSELKKAGGKVHRVPAEIPNVGRFSVVADPQGAMFMLFKSSSGEAPPPPAGGTPGHVGWHELYATDWKTAFDFYAGQFGWTKDQAVDMGPMGTYQLFAAGGPAIGGMMDKPPGVPSPAWLFYVNIDAADAVATRVTDSGGRVLNGPMQVPGGSWILQCMDPQGAMFALVAPTR
jgi:predicted enzyme related to lactoylglutathione lyase